MGGLEEVARRRRNKKNVGISYQPSEEIIGGNNENEINSSLVGSPKAKTLREMNKSPSRLRGEKLREIEQDNVVDLEEAIMA